MGKPTTGHDRRLRSQRLRLVCYGRCRQDETVFGGRLTYTNMLHSRPLIGKAFQRRFRSQLALLGITDRAGAPAYGKDFRQLDEPPTHEELEKLWAADKTALGIN